MTFMLELCRLIGHYRDCFSGNGEGGVSGRQRSWGKRDVRHDSEPKEVHSRSEGGGREAREGDLEVAAVPALRGGRVRVRRQFRDQSVQRLHSAPSENGALRGGVHSRAIESEELGAADGECGDAERDSSAGELGGGVHAARSGPIP